MVFVAAVAMWVTAGCGRRAVDLMDRADALLDDRPDSDNRKRKDEYVSGAICKEL